MNTLLQVSDTHFGCHDPQVVQALSMLVDRSDPTHIVFTGDLTQRAQADEFQDARQFIDRLGRQRTTVLAGNHDIPLFHLFDRLLRPHARQKQAIGPGLEPGVDDRSLCLIGVNSVSRWRHKNGVLSQGRIDEVALQLASAPVEALRVVALHHPVCVQREKDRHDLVRGHEQAIDSWVGAGADIIMGGHIHLPYACPLTASSSGAERQGWAVQAGTAVSVRLRTHTSQSVNLLRWADPPGGCRPQVELQRWDYDATARGFVPAAFQDLPLTR